jgi:hypothetical protein
MSTIMRQGRKMSDATFDIFFTAGRSSRPRRQAKKPAEMVSRTETEPCTAPSMVAIRLASDDMVEVGVWGVARGKGECALHRVACAG